MSHPRKRRGVESESDKAEAKKPKANIDNEASSACEVIERSSAEDGSNLEKSKHLIVEQSAVQKEKELDIRRIFATLEVLKQCFLFSQFR